MHKIKITIIFLLVFSSGLSAQLFTGNNFGINLGVIGAFGTHVQRFGIVIQGYSFHKNYQVNAAIRFYNNFKDLGPKLEHPELNASLGLSVGYGSKTINENFFISTVGNQTGYTNSVAYSYNVWLNKIKTSQVTGIIGLQFNHFSIISENDALAKRFLDRFRTGALLFQYQNKRFQYAINMTMWTGKLGSGVRNDSIFPPPGYINTVNGVYSTLSHGLLTAQFNYVDNYSQNYQINTGIDADQIRNVIQNKMIHDMPFIPKKWNKAHNLHFPMIDRNNNQYLYRKDQQIRRVKLIINGYLNPTVFY